MPLGAGACVDRRSGRLYERIDPRWPGRPSAELYHSALIATMGDHRWVIEMTR